jgi:hypothetical protein
MNAKQYTGLSIQEDKCKVIPVLLVEHRAMKAHWVSGGIAPLILDLGTRWR